MVVVFLVWSGLVPLWSGLVCPPPSGLVWSPSGLVWSGPSGNTNPKGCQHCYLLDGEHQLFSRDMGGIQAC